MGGVDDDDKSKKKKDPEVQPYGQPVYSQQPGPSVYPPLPGQPAYPKQPYGPPAYPAQPHGPPAYPAQPYGPPAYPAQPYGPPVYPAQPYGPPAYPTQQQGPPVYHMQPHGQPPYGPPPPGQHPMHVQGPGGQMIHSPQQPSTPQRVATPPPVQWITTPPENPCPPGMEYLTTLDQVIVKQETHIMEVVLPWECANEYRIYNSLGQPVYNALEESNLCCRQCCSNSRSFTMHIMDNVGQEVIQVRRPFKCCAESYSWLACCRCCQDEITVTDREGRVLGNVREGWSLWKPCYHIYDEFGNARYSIEGPCCTCTCCHGQVVFTVLAINGEPIGEIRKMWSGAAKELFTDADNFGVNFPVDMDVKLKAVLLGTVFLIDFMFFEKENQDDKTGVGAAIKI